MIIDFTMSIALDQYDKKLALSTGFILAAGCITPNNLSDLLYIQTEIIVYVFVVACVDL